MEVISSSRKRDGEENKELSHVTHKIPSGDGPYVRAKHAQVVEKDLETAIVLFWKAINEGDRLESALKDMAVVMKQLDRGEEAIEAIKSFRGLCSKQSQNSLDNVLLDLYKKCGKINEQIEMIKRKLRQIYKGGAFNGRPTKTARSHGKKFKVSVKQEIARLLGNLGWAYMQKLNYMAAEVVYRKAQMIDPDANKACSLGLSLIRQARYDEAQLVLEDVLQGKLVGSDDPKSIKRAEEFLMELESERLDRWIGSFDPVEPSVEDDCLVMGIERLMEEMGPLRSKRLPIFEEISQFRDQLAC